MGATSQFYFALYVPVHKAIMDHWIAVVGINAGAVLMFVNERTLRYGKQSERIPRRHFLNGVRSKSGDVIHAGLPMGKTTLLKSIEVLELENLLLIREERYRHSGNRYAIDTDIILARAA